MRINIATEPVNKWVVWTDFDKCGRPTDGQMFADKSDAELFALQTKGKLEFVGDVYPAF